MALLKSLALSLALIHGAFAQAPGAVAGAGGAPVAPAAPPGPAGVSPSPAPVVSTPAAAADPADAVPTSDPSLLGSVMFEGTWSSKSNAVFTGPQFYDPVDELLIEPALPGMSYSFTSDGFFEQALYQVTGNATNHECPTAVLIYQHGTYTMLANHTLILEPFAVDGRQLLSDPCSNKESIYSRYNSTIIFEKWAVSVDEYHGQYRLDLYQYNGSPLPPLYLAYMPPMMLPTITMNPTADSTSGAAKSTATNASLRRRIRRSLENRNKTPAIKKKTTDHANIWWTGVIFMGIGATGLIFSL